MSTHIIIDGYNLTGREDGAGSLKGPGVDSLGHIDLDGARSRLIERLKSYRKIRRVRVTVVFDGAGSGSLSRSTENRSGIKVVYSREGEDADTVIRDMVRATPGVTVVTSDRSVSSYVEARGGVAVGTDEFLDLLYMAEYEDVKGAAPDDEWDEPVSGKKKGPSKRPPKDKRRKLRKLKKL